MNKSLSVILTLVALATIAALVYTVAFHSTGEKFTEFYILGAEGKAENYPTQLKVGEKASLSLGIINREQATVSYEIEIKINGSTAGRLGPIVLEEGEKYEELATFTPDQPGDDQQVEFLLYKEGQTDVYESIRLWINVAPMP